MTCPIQNLRGQEDPSAQWPNERHSGLAERVLEIGSYHAMVTCVAAGSGIALMPHSVVQALHAEREVSILPLPARFSEATTFLVWLKEHRSAALDALRRELGKENAG